jgi:hypothetical protein
LPSEVIVLYLYTRVLFYFKLKETDENLKISSDLINVYNSLLYIDLLHRYHYLIDHRLGVIQVFEKFSKILNGQFSKYSDENIKIAIFNQDNLKVLRRILDHNLDFGVLHFMIDVKLWQEQPQQQNEQEREENHKVIQREELDHKQKQQKQQIQEILDLVRDLQTMENSNSDLLNFLKSIDIDNFTLKFFFTKLRSPEDLNFVREVFKSDSQNLLVEYREKKMTMIGEIISRCTTSDHAEWLDESSSESSSSSDESSGESSSESPDESSGESSGEPLGESQGESSGKKFSLKMKAIILTTYEKFVDQGRSRDNISKCFSIMGKDVTDCIMKVHEEINNDKKYNLFEEVVENQTKTEKAKEKFSKLVNGIKIMLKENEDLVVLLETIFKSKLQQNPDLVITKRLEGMALLANTNLHNLISREFQTIKNLLSKNHFTRKILTAYKIFDFKSLDISHYTKLFEQNFKLKQIQSLLQVNEEEKASLKTITGFLLDNRIGRELLTCKQVYDFIQNWYSLKFNEIPRLQKIFDFMQNNKIYTRDYQTSLEELGYKEFNRFISDDPNIQGKDMDLIYVINRMKPLMEHILINYYWKSLLVEKDVLGIEDIEENMRELKENGAPQSNHKEGINSNAADNEQY